MGKYFFSYYYYSFLIQFTIHKITAYKQSKINVMWYTCAEK